MKKSIQFRGSEIAYTITGNGKPVLFIHGFAEDSGVWTEIKYDLERSYKVIIPDVPGSGQSDILMGSHISMMDYADCIKAILDDENIESVSMIGHSMGGYIMLAFAEKYPEALLSAGLFHSSAYADDSEKVTARKKSISFIIEKGPAAFLKTTIPGLFKDADKSKQHISDLIKKGENFTADSLIQYYEAMIARPDRTGILKKFTKPVLFIAGVYDKAIPFQQSLQQVQLPAISYVYILRNSGHMGMLEEPVTCLKILKNFLQDT